MATSNAFYAPTTTTTTNINNMELRGGKTKGTPTGNAYQGQGQGQGQGAVLSPAQNSVLHQHNQMSHNMMEQQQQQQGLYVNHSQNHANPLAPLTYLSTISPHQIKTDDTQQQQQQLYNMSRLHNNTQSRLQPHQSQSFQFYDPLNHVQYYSQQQPNPAVAAAAAAAASWQQQLLTNPYAFSGPSNAFPYKLNGVSSGNHEQLPGDNRPPMPTQVTPQLLAQNTNDWLCENAEAREKGKRRKYCPHEVTALVMGVQKYADESCPWSLILRDEELGHLFHGRSGVDLKDKWRTLTKSRPELTSYTENRRIHRKYRPFTSDEEVALLQGVERYHEQRNVWSLILEDKELGVKFNNRSNVQLKDKYRTMKRAGLLKNCPVSALLPSGRRRKTVTEKKTIVKQENVKNEESLQDIAATGQNFTTFLGNPNEHYPYGNDTGNLYGNLMNMKDDMTVPMPLNYHRLGNVSSLNVGMGVNLTLLEGNASTSESANGNAKSSSNAEVSTTSTSKSVATPNSKLLNTFFVKPTNTNGTSTEIAPTLATSTSSSTTTDAAVKSSEGEKSGSTGVNTIAAVPPSKNVNRDKPVIICNV